jgi:hypothetical protein
MRNGNAVRGGALLFVAATVCSQSVLATPAPARANTPEDPGTVQITRSDAGQRIAPGTTYRTFEVATTHGTVTGYQLTVDLANEKVKVGLLHPPSVAQRMAVSDMADAQHAVAGVNGDFFDISESDHPGVPPTGSSEGSEVSDFQALKGPVPEGQAFAGPLPGPPSTNDVLAIGANHRASVTTLTVKGTVRTPTRSFQLTGVNQYAIPVGGIDLFTHAWGETSRLRATCGDDVNRSAPCATDVAVATIRNGRVVVESTTPGSGDIPDGTSELVGREQGADFLRGLRVGDPVNVSYGLQAENSGSETNFAIGGFRILIDGRTVDGVDQIGAVPAARTGAGISADGRTLYLATVDGNESSSGLTCTEVADLLRSFGADDAVDLDGGGSSTFVTRDPGADQVTVRNKIASGVERPVPNGVGIFLN